MIAFSILLYDAPTTEAVTLRRSLSSQYLLLVSVSTLLLLSSPLLTLPLATLLSFSSLPMLDVTSFIRSRSFQSLLLLAVAVVEDPEGGVDIDTAPGFLSLSLPVSLLFY